MTRTYNPVFRIHRGSMLRSLSILATAALFQNCTQGDAPTVFDPNYQPRPAPVIQSVSPSSGLAGVTRITITGQNFSAVAAENLVYFDAARASLLSVSTTQLVVHAPNVVSDSIRLRVSVLGAELFSNTVWYRLEPTFVELQGIGLVDEPWGIAVDGAGNVYVSLVSNQAGVGVKKITPDGVRSDYAPRRFETKYQSLRFGPDGLLYGAWNVNAIAQLPGENVQPVLWATLPAGRRVYDLDFDTGGNLWAAGNNDFIFRISPDKSVKSFSFRANLRAVRIAAGHLYVAGRTFPDSLEKVVRFPIVSPDSLGPAEVYFNYSTWNSAQPGKSIYSLAISAQGEILVGTDQDDPMILIRSDRTAELFYPGILEPTMHILVWAQGTQLLAVRGTAAGGAVSVSSKILRINTQLPAGH